MFSCVHHCDKCNKTFARSNSFHRHLESHTKKQKVTHTHVALSHDENIDINNTLTPATLEASDIWGDSENDFFDHEQDDLNEDEPPSDDDDLVVEPRVEFSATFSRIKSKKRFTGTVYS